MAEAVGARRRDLHARLGLAGCPGPEFESGLSE
jgi:hypothetical protein